MAVHRLARLVVIPPNSTIDLMIATVIDQSACEAHVALASHPDVPAELLWSSLRDLRALSRFDGAVKAVDETERIMLLDSVARARDEPGDDIQVGNNGISNFIKGVSIDWNVVMRELNISSDGLVAAMKTKGWKARTAAVDNFDHKLNADHMKELEALKAGARFNRNARSRLLASVLNAIILHSLGTVVKEQDRANMRLDMTMVALALAVYRAEHEEYPESLDALVPELLDKVPLDLFSGGPLIYERRGDGYLLYSYGPDGVDDGGSNTDGTIENGEWGEPAVDINYAKEDFVIRVPVPPLSVGP